MLIFLYGEEIFRLSEKVSEIKNKYLANNKSGSLPIIINFLDDIRKPNFGDISQAIDSQGLFSEKQLVIIRNIFRDGSKEITEKCLDFLKKNKGISASRDIVLVFEEGSLPKAKDKLFSYLEKNAKKQKFENLSYAELSRWITERIKKINPQTKITPAAIGQLITYVGNDLFQLNNEIEKLAAYKSQGGIETADVENLVKAKIDTNIFETVEELANRNKKKALRYFHNQIEAGADPYYILSMYVYQFRNLLKISEYYQPERSLNQYDISKKTGLHPFVVQKGLVQLKNLTLDKLKSIYQKLQIIDQETKTGKADIVLALDMFIAEI